MTVPQPDIKWNMVGGFGVVEDRQDPLKLGRVRVRVVGIHTSNKIMGEGIPTEDLPWAMVMMPATSASISGVGSSPNLVEGSWVMVIFMDGENYQQPIVLGSFHGMPEINAELLIEGFAEGPASPGGANQDAIVGRQYVTIDGFCDPREPDELAAAPKIPGFIEHLDTGEGSIKEEISTAPHYPYYPNESDISRLARGEQTTSTVVERKKADIELGQMEIASARAHSMEALTDFGLPWSEIPTPYAALYPWNRVVQTESGHILEVDDTPGAERIHEYHRSGSFREIHPDGTRVVKTTGMDQKIVLKDSQVHIEGKQNIVIDKGAKLLINRDGEPTAYDIEVGPGGNLNISVMRGDVNLSILDGNMYKYVNGDVVEHVTGDWTTTIDGNKTLTVLGNRTATVEGQDSVEVTGDRTESLHANHTVTVDQNADETVEVNKTVTVKANYTQDTTRLMTVLAEARQSHYQSFENTINDGYDLKQIEGVSFLYNGLSIHQYCAGVGLFQNSVMSLPVLAFLIFQTKIKAAGLKRLATTGTSKGISETMAAVGTEGQTALAQGEFNGLVELVEDGEESGLLDVMEKGIEAGVVEEITDQDALVEIAEVIDEAEVSGLLDVVKDVGMSDVLDHFLQTFSETLIPYVHQYKDSALFSQIKQFKGEDIAKDVREALDTRMLDTIMVEDPTGLVELFLGEDGKDDQPLTRLLKQGDAFGLSKIMDSVGKDVIGGLIEAGDFGTILTHVKEQFNAGNLVQAFVHDTVGMETALDTGTAKDLQDVGNLNDELGLLDMIAANPTVDVLGMLDQSNKEGLLSLIEGTASKYATKFSAAVHKGQFGILKDAATKISALGVDAMVKKYGTEAINTYLESGNKSGLKALLQSDGSKLSRALAHNDESFIRDVIAEFQKSGGYDLCQTSDALKDVVAKMGRLSQQKILKHMENYGHTMTRDMMDGVVTSGLLDLVSDTGKRSAVVEILHSDKADYYLDQVLTLENRSLLKTQSNKFYKHKLDVMSSLGVNSGAWDVLRKGPENGLDKTLKGYKKSGITTLFKKTKETGVVEMLKNFGPKAVVSLTKMYQSNPTDLDTRVNLLKKTYNSQSRLEDTDLESTSDLREALRTTQFDDNRVDRLQTTKAIQAEADQYLKKRLKKL